MVLLLTQDLWSKEAKMKNIFRPVITNKQWNAVLNAYYKAINESDLDKINIFFFGEDRQFNGNNHDVDILGFPKPNGKLGESLEQWHKYHDIASNILRKDHNIETSISSRKSTQALLTNETKRYLKKNSNNADIVQIHSLFYNDISDIANREPKEFFNSVNKNNMSLQGDFSDFSKVNLLNQKTKEPYFFLEEFGIPYKAGKIEEFLLKITTEETVDYLNQHYGLNLEKSKDWSIKECISISEKILKQLDEINYN